MTREQLNEAVKRALGTTLDEMNVADLEGLLMLVRNDAAIRALVDEIARRERL